MAENGCYNQDKICSFMTAAGGKGSTMARYTEKVILQTFGEMLDEMPFDKITVSALTRRSDISHNTFYYHYKDINDLLRIWIRNEIEPYLGDKREHISWDLAIKAMLEAWKGHARRIEHVFYSLSREQLEHRVFDQMAAFFFQQLRKLPDAAGLSETQLQKISDYARYMVFGFLMQFVRSGMQGDIDAGVHDLDVLLRCFLTNTIEQAHAGNLS